MNSRLEALVKRGYPKEVVERLSSFNEYDLEYAVEKAFEHISRNCNTVDTPISFYVGGQPGCGKTGLSMNLKNKYKNIVEIGIDNYRMYHPHYLEIEKHIKKFWEDKKESINDTPGNDIADFTHEFAGVMTDKLIEKATNQKYNVILEWGMREPNGPLKSMEDLKNKGYINNVIFVCVYKDTSLEACSLRANIMKDSNHIIRKVPPSFHEICIKTLPDSIDKIYEEGFSKNIIDNMSLCLRDGKIIWNNSESKINPGSIFNMYLNNYELTKDFKNNNLIAYRSTKNEFRGLEENNLKKKSA